MSNTFESINLITNINIGDFNMETKNFCDACLRTDKYCVDYWAAGQQIIIATNRFKVVLSRTAIDEIYGYDFMNGLANSSLNVDSINCYIDKHIKDIVKAGREYKIVRVIALKDDEFNIDEPVIITDNIDNHIVCPLQMVTDYIATNFNAGKTIDNLTSYEVMEIMQAVKQLYSSDYDTIQ